MPELAGLITGLHSLLIWVSGSLGARFALALKPADNSTAVAAAFLAVCGYLWLPHLYLSDCLAKHLKESLLLFSN